MTGGSKTTTRTFAGFEGLDAGQLVETTSTVEELLTLLAAPPEAAPRVSERTAVIVTARQERRP